MKSDLFLLNLPEKTGQLIYQSLWSPHINGKSYPVKIYEHCISYDSLYLSFHFDLKFKISNSTITFYQLQQAESFELTLDDGNAWKRILKQYLNIVGFHQAFKPYKKIGKGNFASVYLVQKIEDGKQYAVKAFSKEATFSEQNGKESLIKQVQIMRKLNSPYNMRLFQVYQSDNSIYMIFQLLEGGQLYQKIKAKHKFTHIQIRNIMKGLLKGLQEMHSKGIMHRDLKPQNILFRNQQEFECIIADFGLAEFASSEEYLFVRCGTPGYVAPEIINIKDMKAKYSPICDLFSLGLIFHILLLGRSLFNGKTYNEVLTQNRQCNFTLQGPDYQKLQKNTLDLLQKLLKINPKQRISAKQALQHKYILDQCEESEMKMQEQIQQMNDKYEIDQTPILITNNQKRQQDRQVKRDSCIVFKMGKDNIFTGKTQTVGNVGSSKISAFGVDLSKALKPSKFVQSQAQKENI